MEEYAAQSDGRYNITGLNQRSMELLHDVLAMHLEGMADAREKMIEDPVSFSDIETFTETLQQHDLDVEAIESIKEQVLNGISAGLSPADG